MLLRNSLANFAGQLLIPVLSLALIPFYLRHLGLAGYGLVGFLAMLVSLLGVFTKGVGAALQREIARRAHSPTAQGTLPSLIRTFEVGYAAVGLVLGILLALLSTWVARSWIPAGDIPSSVVEICIWLTAARVAVAFPQSVYEAVFIGTQRQTLGSALAVANSLVAAAVGVGAILLFNSVVGFYAVVVASAALSVVVLRTMAWRVLRSGFVGVKAFNFQEIKVLARFSAGLIWTNGIGLVVTQLDRLILSKITSLANLGVYNTAAAGGRLLSMSYVPFMTAAYPQTCQLVADSNFPGLEKHLLRNAKVVMIACTAVGIPIALFAKDILLVWTRNLVVANAAATTMAVYIIGSICISNAGVLYQAQMALGRSQFGVWFNTVALVWFPICLWQLISRYGINGAAWGWAIYAATAWLYNVAVISRLLRPNFSLLHYGRSLSAIAIAGSCSSALGFYLARMSFASFLPGRVIVAGLAVLLAFTLSYVTAFGLALPQEVHTWFGKTARPS